MFLLTSAKRLHLRVCLKPIVKSNDILVSQFSHDVHLPLQREQVLGTFVQFGDKLERHNLHSNTLAVCFRCTDHDSDSRRTDSLPAWCIFVCPCRPVQRTLLQSPPKHGSPPSSLFVMVRSIWRCAPFYHVGLAVGRCRASCSTSATFPREIR